mmetsp:Transcript_18278/g.25150  ORF Transcript_18278/g.25150 Transcript_18278/m.25150 type:complete len:301 (-) Transcript_18278:137-1039(-)
MEGNDTSALPTKESKTTATLIKEEDQTKHKTTMITTKVEDQTENNETMAPIKEEDKKLPSEAVVTQVLLQDKPPKRIASFNPRITSTDWVGHYAGESINDVPMSHVFSDNAPFDKEYYENAPDLRGASCDDLIQEYMYVEKHFTNLMGVAELRPAKICPELSVPKREEGEEITIPLEEVKPPPPAKAARSVDLKLDDIIKTNYCEPTDLDVLMGRGGLTNHHHGNRLYREEADKLREWYVSCTKREKYHVSELLVKYVESYGGRFLEYDEASGHWYEAPQNRARKKASQALREYKKRKHK